MIHAPSQLTHEASSEEPGEPSLPEIRDKMETRNKTGESRSRKLSEAEMGSWVCTEVDGPGESVNRMRSLGICVGRPLDLVAVGDPMIIQVGSAQIGLSRYLASQVTVRSCDLVDGTKQGQCLEGNRRTAPNSSDSASI